MTPNDEAMVAVNDGETLSIYYGDPDKILAELRALKEDDEDTPGMAYSFWCAEHDPLVTTGNGDDPQEIAEAISENSLPTIYWSADLA